MVNNPSRSALLPLPPLLITESQEEFNQIREAFYAETWPLGIIEQMYVEESVDNNNWQILRLKRCKAGVINLMFHQSSANILGRLMQAGPDLARDRISDPESAKKVETALATYKLDGSVIIADAIKKSAYQLELIETQLGSLEARRDKVRIAQYRGELGAVLRKASDRLRPRAIGKIRPYLGIGSISFRKV